MYKKLLISVAVAFALTACVDDTKPSVAAIPQPTAPVAPAPVVVQQADNGVSNMLTGAALGYMLGSASSNKNNYTPPPANNTTVIHKTVIVEKKVPTPSAPAVPNVKAEPLKPSVPVASEKTVPNKTSPATPAVANRLSLSKPAVSNSGSFGGFKRSK